MQAVFFCYSDGKRGSGSRYRVTRGNGTQNCYIPGVLGVPVDAFLVLLIFFAVREEPFAVRGGERVPLESTAGIL